MKRFVPPILALLLVFSAILVYADDNNAVERPWSDDLPLPKWETPAEKQVPPEAADDVTPPPTEPVRAVAEFEWQEGVQLAYPFGWDDMFVEMVRECQEVGVVYMVVENTASMSNCSNLLSYNGVPLDNIEYVFHPMNSMWSRDYGPHFVWGETSDEIAMVDWQYYDSRPNDDEIPDYMADMMHMNFYETPIYHEGGNYMSDGHGTAMCSDVLYSNNQSWSYQQCEQELMDYFGVNDVHVYERITWDATGHIDLWAKIVNDTTILVARMQPDDPNYNLVEQHAAAMGQVQTVYGTPFNIQRVQMPPAYTFWIWHYYKSFMNSLIFNGKVLVPIFTTEPALTTQALAAYQAAMPDYEVVGIYSDAICSAGGAIHCTTIGFADHIEDYYHDASISATPVAPPIQIPASGGSFNFDALVTNNEADSIHTEVWSEITLPSGSTIGPMLNRHVMLPAGGSAS
ncbi:agmatine deiminase family protein, partial [bacterium]|nr:agmatine deiminase family protein [bacterium]